MTTTTLPAAPDVERAVTDRDYYDQQVYQLKGRELAAFEAAVAAAAPAFTPQPLTDREKQIIAFAGLRFRHPGAREQAIRDRFDLSAARYHQQLNWLLDRPEALAYAPWIIAPLRHQRDTRRNAREGRTVTAGSTP